MAYPNDTAKVEIGFLLSNNQDAVVVHHVRTASGSDFDVPRCDQVNNLYADWIQNADFEGETNAALLGSLSLNTTVSFVRTTGLETPATPQAELTINAVGTGAGDPMPAETALVCTWRTALAGRSFRGRSYWPGVREAFNDADGEVEPTSLAGFQATMQALVDGLINDGGFRHVVHSRTLGSREDTTVAVSREVWHHISSRNP